MMMMIIWVGSLGRTVEKLVQKPTLS